MKRWQTEWLRFCLIVSPPFKYVNHLRERLRQGEIEYGDSSWSKSRDEVISEIREELLDTFGWSMFLVRRLDLRERAKLVRALSHVRKAISLIDEI